MSTIQEPPIAATSLLPEAMPFLFNAEAFFRMIEADIFRREDRVELWDGRIYEKMAKTQAHAVSGNKSYLALVRVLPVGWFPGGENPVMIDQVRVPLPDLVVLRGVPDDFIDRRPNPADVGLIVEFSLTSLKSDTGAKLRGYAEAGIPAYWVVNLVKNVIQTYEAPVPEESRYANEAVYAVGQSVPLRLNGVLIAEIPAFDLLPIRG